MRLSRLKLVNFRNYKEAEVDTNRRVILLLGGNAQGKTNLLEAIYLLAITKSFRLRREADLVKRGKSFARVEADFKKTNKGTSKIEVIIKKDQRSQQLHKQIKLDNQSISARGLLGSFLAVLFCPEDINLIRNVPGSRRRFLDIISCLVSSEYCEKLIEYNKIVKNRNKVLSRVNENRRNKEELVFWNNELADKGSFIVHFRQDLVLRLDKLSREYYRKISSKTKKGDVLKLSYLPSFSFPKESDIETVRLRFRSEILKKEDKEIERQQTIIGPHRDDFHFILGGRNIIYRGSRGEFRSTILSLKLAELSFLEEELGERPVLLLDDVFSELDQERSGQVSKIIPQQQTFVTTTNLGNIASSLKREALLLEVKGGEITKM